MRNLCDDFSSLNIDVKIDVPDSMFQLGWFFQICPCVSFGSLWFCNWLFTIYILLSSKTIENPMSCVGLRRWTWGWFGERVDMGGWELGREENYRKMHNLLALGNSKHWDSRKDKCPELYVMPLIFETYGCCHNEVAEFFRIVFSFYFRLIIEDTHWKQVERLHLVRTQPNLT